MADNTDNINSNNTMIDMSKLLDIINDLDEKINSIANVVKALGEKVDSVIGDIDGKINSKLADIQEEMAKDTTLCIECREDDCMESGCDYCKTSHCSDCYKGKTCAWCCCAICYKCSMTARDKYGMCNNATLCMDCAK